MEEQDVMRLLKSDIAAMYVELKTEHDRLQESYATLEANYLEMSNQMEATTKYRMDNALHLLEGEVEQAKLQAEFSAQKYDEEFSKTRELTTLARNLHSCLALYANEFDQFTQIQGTNMPVKGKLARRILDECREMVVKHNVGL